MFCLYYFYFFLLAKYKSCEWIVCTKLRRVNCWITPTKAEFLVKFFHRMIFSPLLCPSSSENRKLFDTLMPELMRTSQHKNLLKFTILDSLKTNIAYLQAIKTKLINSVKQIISPF